MDIFLVLKFQKIHKHVLLSLKLKRSCRFLLCSPLRASGLTRVSLLSRGQSRLLSIIGRIAYQKNLRHLIMNADEFNYKRQDTAARS